MNNFQICIFLHVFVYNAGISIRIYLFIHCHLNCELHSHKGQPFKKTNAKSSKNEEEKSCEIIQKKENH